MAADMKGIVGQARRIAYQVFGRLPPRVRRGIVRVAAPSFTVGALAVIHDGTSILLVRQLHRAGLALPGGLLQKGEAPRAALIRELAEEIGLQLDDLDPSPSTAHVDAGKRRVDIIWLVPVDRASLAVTTGSEILSYEWRRSDDSGLTPQTAEIMAGIASRLPR